MLDKWLAPIRRLLSGCVFYTHPAGNLINLCKHSQNGLWFIRAVYCAPKAVNFEQAIRCLTLLVRALLGAFERYR